MGRQPHPSGLGAVWTLGLASGRAGGGCGRSLRRRGASGFRLVGGVGGVPGRIGLRGWGGKLEGGGHEQNKNTKRRRCQGIISYHQRLWRRRSKERIQRRCKRMHAKHADISRHTGEHASISRAAVHAVIASEAKQSPWRLPRRCAPRNDRTTRTTAIHPISRRCFGATLSHRPGHGTDAIRVHRPVSVNNLPLLPTDEDGRIARPAVVQSKSTPTCDCGAPRLRRMGRDVIDGPN